MHKAAAKPKEPLSNSISEVGFRWIICVSNPGISFKMDFGYEHKIVHEGTLEQVSTLIESRADVNLRNSVKYDDGGGLI